MKAKFGMLGILGIAALLTAFAPAQAAAVPENPVYPRPLVVPIPAATTGVKQPVVSLNVAWKVNVTAPANFWNNTVAPSSWQDTQIPSHAVTQGIILSRGGQYAFKKQVTVPAEFAGKRVLLQFDGVTGEGKAWVNGVHLADHYGGFTTWGGDVTDQITPGKPTWIAVASTDATGMSGYDNGGILRGVKLIALPQDYISRFNIETVLDKSCNNAVLKVWVAMTFNQGRTARIDLVLKDVLGRAVALNPSRMELTRENPETIVEIPVAAPVKWDAEHPNLYTLEAGISDGGATAGTVVKQIGFRKVETAGKELLVNGKPVKLRGICRKDIYPLTGRSVPIDVIEEDIRLFRAANINYIRTSHYPTNPEMLEFADRYGMYIEEENSVAMSQVGNNATYLDRYLSQLSEMVERDRSHPSVIMWSLGNESGWGNDVLKEAAYARAEDPSRPLMYSWSHLVPPELSSQVQDIYSFHYASTGRDLAAGGPVPGGDLTHNRELGTDKIGIPVLHDEYAHIPVYIISDLQRDPGIREFWGRSIKLFWERMFVTQGALGGAIWCGVDNSSIAPTDRQIVSRNDWGIIDGWRREKPEYWLTKKAYSPVRIDDQPAPNPGPGRPLPLAVKNWFDHTNLNEVAFQWTVGGESGTLNGPNVEPHKNGVLQIPARDWKDGEVVNLKVFRMGNILVDEYNLPVNPPPTPALPKPQGPAPTVDEQTDSLQVKGADFALTFSRETGLITDGSYKGAKIIESGPYLNLVGQQLGPWSLKTIRATRDANEAVINISGSYSVLSESMGGRGGGGRGAATGPVNTSPPRFVETSFEVRVDGQGLITTRYTLGALPALTRPLLAEGTHRDPGGYWELGVSYVLTNGVDRLSWQRQGLWSAYPEDHIGRNVGVATREGKGAQQQYGVKPSWPSPSKVLFCRDTDPC